MRKRSETAAGGVVFRRGPGGPEVVVGEQRDRVSRERTRRLPKGKLDAGETLEQAALREVREETGLAARIVAPLGSVAYVYRDERGEVAKTVHFFLMEWQPGAAAATDGELERIAWLSPEHARKTLSYETERGVVERAERELARLASARAEAP
jgi:8-oxo-dGTP pyrophosphatase MutT (NUDIX family)